MIAGIGTDIIEIARIEAAYGRHGRRFAERILGPQEMLKFERRLARASSRGMAFLATRFAAKEAFSKAIGLGMHMPMYWRAIEVVNEPSGRPVVLAHDGVASLMAERRWTASVSVSDERLFAVAFVVIEQKQ
jgi:holo-[acyl-carrier protein] synthase